MESRIQLRCFRADDLPSADNLRQSAGWNQTLNDWRRLVALDPEGCFVAVDGDEIAGTATTTSFGTDLAWIGMVLVDPARRNQGIGRLLLNHCLQYLQEKGVRCIKLDATPAGQILYEKLGFKIEWPLARWMRTDSPRPDILSPACHVTPASAGGWREMLELDRQAFGLVRESLLQHLRDDSTRVVTCRAKKGARAGFGFLRDGINADYIGPVVAETVDAGKSITLDLLRSTQRPVYWDIPGPCVEAENWAMQLGFVQQRPFLRMYLGQNDVGGIPSKVWAISDPATG